jgi:hypothetical protein
VSAESDEAAEQGTNGDDDANQDSQEILSPFRGRGCLGYEMAI